VIPYLLGRDFKKQDVHPHCGGTLGIEKLLHQAGEYIAFIMCHIATLEKQH